MILCRCCDEYHHTCIEVITKTPHIHMTYLCKECYKKIFTASA